LTQGTLDIFDVLGLDADDLRWADLALCIGHDVSRFYDGYESSQRTAKLTDQMCLSCPVRRECLKTGIENGEWGVWGAVYLSNGKMDENRNSHKTPEIWQQIREGISE
jgi:hypothetical protein